MNKKQRTQRGGSKIALPDSILNRIRNPRAREALLIGFRPIEGSKIGELTAYFEIVIDRTPGELEDDQRWELGKPQCPTLEEAMLAA